MFTVCILTAGKGTRMGSYSQYINKSLLPIDRKATISHIIKKFPPETEFVIALGYLGQQVVNYLKTAHSSLNIRFVNVDNYEGLGSGPGYSLLCCQGYLQKPFFFVSCDTLWQEDLDFSLNENWLGVAKVPEEESQKYCNLKVDSGKIVDIRDKEAVSGSEYYAFIGLCYIKDHQVFWDGLRAKNIVAGEHQVSNGIRALIESRQTLAMEVQWNDVGDLEKYTKVLSQYENYDFSKINEFIYIVNRKVIKFFANEAIAEKRVKKANLNPRVFPKISYHQGQFYSYEFLTGKTLYEDNNHSVFSNFLSWLERELWQEVQFDAGEMSNVCSEFYYSKTIKRLKLYHDKYNYTDDNSTVNGVEIPPTKVLLEQVPWGLLSKAVPSFMHGDLQFDNVLYDRESSNFYLLDWRQDFGGFVEVGDLYYDLAKLYGGIVLNYDYIKLNLFTYNEKDGEIEFDFAQRFMTNVYLEILVNFINSKGLKLEKVKLLVALIYLNMSPLHHYPFDKMLYSLGRLRLFQELEALA